MQLLLIDDGSRDNTAAVIRSEIEARRDQPAALPISLIEPTRNFGKEAATAGWRCRRWANGLELCQAPQR